jgi:hypothetical protein
MSRQEYIGANKQMQDLRRRRNSNSSGSVIVDFDKVKEPVNAGKKAGRTLFNF